MLNILKYAKNIYFNFKKSIIRLCYFLKYNCNMLYYSLLVLKYKISTKKRAYFILTLKTNYLFFQNSHR